MTGDYIESGDDSALRTADVQVIDDPEVIHNCCEDALTRHKLLVCCCCKDEEAAIAAIVVFPIELRRGHPFCGECFQGFSVYDRA
jgi:hypothetical protein